MIHLTVTVADTADLLAVPAYGAGALLRWESAALAAGPFVEGGTVALVALTSLYDIWDAAGVAGVTWYRTRVSNAGGTTFSAYSAPTLPGSEWASLTVDQLRLFVTSQLPDEALTTLLSAAAAAITGVAGATGEVTEYLTGGYTRIVVGRQIGTLTSVTENDVLLTVTDYRASGYVLTRLDSAGNPSTWGTAVVVVYTPADDTAERQRVQLELVKLDLASNPGLASQNIGTWTEAYRTDKTPDEQRAEILASLGASGGGMRVVD